MDLGPGARSDATETRTSEERTTVVPAPLPLPLVTVLSIACEGFVASLAVPAAPVKTCAKGGKLSSAPADVCAGDISPGYVWRLSSGALSASARLDAATGLPLGASLRIDGLGLSVVGKGRSGQAGSGQSGQAGSGQGGQAGLHLLSAPCPVSGRRERCAEEMHGIRPVEDLGVDGEGEGTDGADARVGSVTSSSSEPEQTQVVTIGPTRAVLQPALVDGTAEDGHEAPPPSPIPAAPNSGTLQKEARGPGFARSSPPSSPSSSSSPSFSSFPSSSSSSLPRAHIVLGRTAITIGPSLVHPLACILDALQQPMQRLGHLASYPAVPMEQQPMRRLGLQAASTQPQPGTQGTMLDAKGGTATAVLPAAQPAAVSSASGVLSNHATNAAPAPVPMRVVVDAPAVHLRLCIGPASAAPATHAAIALPAATTAPTSGPSTAASSTTSAAPASSIAPSTEVSLAVRGVRLQLAPAPAVFPSTAAGPVGNAKGGFWALEHSEHAISLQLHLPPPAAAPLPATSASAHGPGTGSHVELPDTAPVALATHVRFTVQSASLALLCASADGLRAPSFTSRVPSAGAAVLTESSAGDRHAGVALACLHLLPAEPEPAASPVRDAAGTVDCHGPINGPIDRSRCPAPIGSMAISGPSPPLAPYPAATKGGSDKGESTGNGPLSIAHLIPHSLDSSRAHGPLSIAVGCVDAHLHETLRDVSLLTSLLRAGAWTMEQVAVHLMPRIHALAGPAPLPLATTRAACTAVPMALATSHTIGLATSAAASDVIPSVGPSSEGSTGTAAALPVSVSEPPSLPPPPPITVYVQRLSCTVHMGGRVKGTTDADTHIGGQTNSTTAVSYPSAHAILGAAEALPAARTRPRCVRPGSRLTLSAAGLRVCTPDASALGGSICASLCSLAVTHMTAWQLSTPPCPCNAVEASPCPCVGVGGLPAASSSVVPVRGSRGGSGDGYAGVTLMELRPVPAASITSDAASTGAAPAHALSLTVTHTSASTEAPVGCIAAAASTSAWTGADSASTRSASRLHCALRLGFLSIPSIPHVVTAATAALSHASAIVQAATCAVSAASSGISGALGALDSVSGASAPPAALTALPQDASRSTGATRSITRLAVSLAGARIDLPLSRAPSSSPSSLHSAQGTESVCSLSSRPTLRFAVDGPSTLDALDVAIGSEACSSFSGTPIAGGSEACSSTAGAGTRAIDAGTPDAGGTEEGTAAAASPLPATGVSVDGAGKQCSSSATRVLLECHRASLLLLQPDSRVNRAGHGSPTPRAVAGDTKKPIRRVRLPSPAASSPGPAAVAGSSPSKNAREGRSSTLVAVTGLQVVAVTSSRQSTGPDCSPLEHPAAEEQSQHLRGTPPSSNTRVYVVLDSIALRAIGRILLPIVPSIAAATNSLSRQLDSMGIASAAVGASVEALGVAVNAVFARPLVTSAAQQLMPGRLGATDGAPRSPGTADAATSTSSPLLAAAVHPAYGAGLAHTGAGGRACLDTQPDGFGWLARARAFAAATDECEPLVVTIPSPASVGTSGSYAHGHGRGCGHGHGAGYGPGHDYGYVLSCAWTDPMAEALAAWKHRPFPLRHGTGHGVVASSVPGHYCQASCGGTRHRSGGRSGSDRIGSSSEPHRGASTCTSRLTSGADAWFDEALVAEADTLHTTSKTIVDAFRPLEPRPLSEVHHGCSLQFPGSAHVVVDAAIGSSSAGGGSRRPFLDSSPAHTSTAFCLLVRTASAIFSVGLKGQPALGELPTGAPGSCAPAPTPAAGPQMQQPQPPQPQQRFTATVAFVPEDYEDEDDDDSDDDEEHEDAGGGGSATRDGDGSDTASLEIHVLCNDIVATATNVAAFASPAGPTTCAPLQEDPSGLSGLCCCPGYQEHWSPEACSSRPSGRFDWTPETTIALDVGHLSAVDFIRLPRGSRCATKTRGRSRSRSTSAEGRATGKTTAGTSGGTPGTASSASASSGNAVGSGGRRGRRVHEASMNRLLAFTRPASASASASASGAGTDGTAQRPILCLRLESLFPPHLPSCSPSLTVDGLLDGRAVQSSDQSSRVDGRPTKASGPASSVVASPEWVAALFVSPVQISTHGYHLDAGMVVAASLSSLQVPLQQSATPAAVSGGAAATRSAASPMSVTTTDVTSPRLAPFVQYLSLSPLSIDFSFDPRGRVAKAKAIALAAMGQGTPGPATAPGAGSVGAGMEYETRGGRAMSGHGARAGGGPTGQGSPAAGLAAGRLGPGAANRVAGPRPSRSDGGDRPAGRTLAAQPSLRSLSAAKQPVAATAIRSPSPSSPAPAHHRNGGPAMGGASDQSGLDAPPPIDPQTAQFVAIISLIPLQNLRLTLPPLRIRHVSGAAVPDRIIAAYTNHVLSHELGTIISSIPLTVIPGLKTAVDALTSSLSLDSLSSAAARGYESAATALASAWESVRTSASGAMPTDAADAAVRLQSLRAVAATLALQASDVALRTAHALSSTARSGGARLSSSIQAATARAMASVPQSLSNAHATASGLVVSHVIPAATAVAAAVGHPSHRTAKGGLVTGVVDEGDWQEASCGGSEWVEVSDGSFGSAYGMAGAHVDDDEEEAEW